jgi:hypothetical protein
LARVHEYEKTYWVMVEGIPTQEKLSQLEPGIQLKDYLTLPAMARLIPDPNLPPRPRPVTPHSPTAWVEIKLRGQETSDQAYDCRGRLAILTPVPGWDWEDSVRLPGTEGMAGLKHKRDQFAQK